MRHLNAQDPALLEPVRVAATREKALTHSDDTTRRARAIETVYNGYRFRSRLEARWAVFFDALGIRWEYEREGYELGIAGRYLPDFWLPSQHTWVEIRPRDSFFYDDKCQALAVASGRRVIYVAGQPWPGEYGVALYGSEDSCTGSDPLVFALGRRDARELWVYREGLGAWCLNGITDDDDEPLPDCADLSAAYAAARGSRFEFGERGAGVRPAPPVAVYLMSPYDPHQHRHIGSNDVCIDCGFSG